MPLIRYELDDLAVKKADRYHITGHREGILYGLNGENISMAAMEVHSLILDKVVSYQFLQKEKGKVSVLVVPIFPLSNGDKNDLLRLFQTKAGEAIKIDIVIADRPQLTERGKYKLLIQEIDWGQ